MKAYDKERLEKKLNPYIPESVIHLIPDYQVTMSFASDVHAEIFKDYWQNGGFDHFVAWAEENQDKYNDL